MKFELVDFYPTTEKNRKKSQRNLVGTVHLYIIDYQIDLRGIRVAKNGKGLYFLMPHIFGQDHETGEQVRYPVFRFTNQKDHDEMMDFLHKEVKPEILKRLKNGKG